MSEHSTHQVAKMLYRIAIDMVSRGASEERSRILASLGREQSRRYGPDQMYRSVIYVVGREASRVHRAGQCPHRASSPVTRLRGGAGHCDAPERRDGYAGRWREGGEIEAHHGQSTLHYHRLPVAGLGRV
jgi:hypothetical protein